MREVKNNDNTYLTLEEDDVIQLEKTPKTVSVIIKSNKGEKYFLKMSKKTFLYFYEKAKKIRRKIKR